MNNNLKKKLIKKIGVEGSRIIARFELFYLRWQLLRNKVEV